MKIKISELSLLTEPKAWKELLPLIEKDGMHFPIVVVQLTTEEWNNLHTRFPVTINKVDDIHKPIHNVVWCGNNRVKVMEELGHTEIEYVLAQSIGMASRICATHNKWHRQKYGALI